MYLVINATLPFPQTWKIQHFKQIVYTPAILEVLMHFEELK